MTTVAADFVAHATTDFIAPVFDSDDEGYELTTQITTAEEKTTVLPNLTIPDDGPWEAIRCGMRVPNNRDASGYLITTGLPSLAEVYSVVLHFHGEEQVMCLNKAVIEKINQPGFVWHMCSLTECDCGGDHNPMLCLSTTCDLCKEKGHWDIVCPRSGPITAEERIWLAKEQEYQLQVARTKEMFALEARLVDLTTKLTEVNAKLAKVNLIMAGEATWREVTRLTQRRNELSAMQTEEAHALALLRK